MAKIFISFFDGISDPLNPNAMSCHYESVLKGFKDSGNDILYFNHKIWGKNFGKAPKKFINEIKKFNPDLIILFDNRCYEDVSDYFYCPIIIWEADSYLYFSNQEKIKKNPDRFYYIVGQTILEKKIKDYFNIKNKNQIYYLPSATSIIAENIPQTTNISFIGTKFYAPDIISEFMHKKPNNNEINQFKKILEYIEKFPFSSDDDILNKFKISSNKIKKNFSVKSIVDVLSVKNRIQTLSTVADLGLDLYGNENWLNDLTQEPNLVMSYKNKLIYTIKENQQIYNSSKISININHAQAQTGFSWRVCDIMASNACLVTQYKKDINYLFPKIKIPTYTNRYEAHEVCKKILKNNNLRREIVLACQQEIDKNYRFYHRIKELEEIIKISLVKNGSSGKITRLQIEDNIFQKKDKINNITFKNKKFRLKTRSILSYYSVMMIINQIPIINKFLTDRTTILNKIKQTIDNENN